ncbi:MAG: 5-formyltetrahydrofolate cyclo-ligase [Actinomycetota bacterium]|nr:5-formyltetrahydrofolate cyclo-ligase [Actinomycetota bacterium]
MADLNRSRDKQALREVMRRVRSAIPPEQRAEMAGRVEEHLFGLPEATDARTVLLFYSFGTEIPTAGMVERLLSGGRRVLLPYLTDEGAMEAAELAPGQSLVRSGYGPKEPSHRVAVEPGEVDVVVTPGLAFDRAGRRLGYGGGHYDRYLRRLSPRALRVGVGFAVQLVREVPAEPQDERVDLVVTEQGVVDCRTG